ncbi:MAG: type II toxin-antitoxin system RelE/ParE family toxin [Symploca sp. SIO1B1]|nr:type II toxin-antitoxin system RelE/ParE family toxin [Symploca sp. SIO1A3]NES00548.1 type II toxin-antitoxin system RelE/ParE family toxin [Symploca sp. SIO1B1]
MAYQVLILPEAEQDLEEAYNWYEEKNTGLGSEFIRVVDASLSTIQRNPFASAVVYKQVRRKLNGRGIHKDIIIANDSTNCFRDQH